MENRRTFFKQVSLAAIGTWVGPPSLLSSHSLSDRAFTLSLRPGNIGVSADMPQTLDLAVRYGFEAISPDAAQLSQMSPDARKALWEGMQEKGIVWGAGGLPVQFRNSQEEFEMDLAKLSGFAAVLQEMRVDRVGTWVMPRHGTLSYFENFDLHRKRLGEVAWLLHEHGIKLGLEYVAPKTIWADRKFSFIRTMREMKQLIDAMYPKNVGIILDSFHWFCADDTLEEIRGLSKEEIVAVDLNDGYRGRSRDEQIDGQRELPLATGVIDLKGFLEALVETGYDGPVRAEPFNKALNDLDNAAACEATAKAMKAAFALVD